MVWPSHSLQRGRDVLNQNIHHRLKQDQRLFVSSITARRNFSSKKSPRKQNDSEPNAKPLHEALRNAALKRAKDKKLDKFAQRDFFFSILGSSTTKREARSYLQRFNLPRDKAKSTTTTVLEAELKQPNVKGCGVNIGSFYNTARAVEQSPKFSQGPEKRVEVKLDAPLHVALVKLRAPQRLDDQVLSGIGRTLRQLDRLGLTSVVVVDCDDPLTEGHNTHNWKQLAAQQADRLVSAIDSHGSPGARKIDIVLSIEDGQADSKAASVISGPVSIAHRQYLTTPLKRGIITVIPCIGFQASTQKMVPLSGNDVVWALACEFSGLRSKHTADDDPQTVAEQIRALRNEVSVDRVIVLDPLGGIPSRSRKNGYHIFLNLEQEYEDVKEDLLEEAKRLQSGSELRPTEKQLSDLGSSNPLSRFVEEELGGPSLQAAGQIKDVHVSDIAAAQSRVHIQNLELVRKVLNLLPPSSSALLTTPLEAANLRKHDNSTLVNVGVGTRRSRNPLIHNLLTDKPVLSSSLPAGRLGSQDNVTRQGQGTSLSPTTFAKKGLSVTMFPDPRLQRWMPPTPGEPRLTLNDPQIDLPRLVHLIEDSFGRKLDVQDYLKRVNDRIAGVIIAGEYEGGALLTWETPAGAVDSGSEESRSRMVPYLDKFAVLKRSQGAGGVADIVFTAMVRDCFPEGVCWRSRRDNPVNKWYFERSRGTWKLPDSNWAMFWTTPELIKDTQKFADYEAVCRSIQPSWADNKPVVD